MAVNKVIYGGNTLVDLTGDTVTAADLADGVKATGADGNPIVGLMKKVTIDSSLSASSTNPVQNKVIKAELDKKMAKTDKIYEANLEWGGRHIPNGFSPVDASMIPELGANRFAFGKAAGITVEYSTDAGKTWLDYGYTDIQKVGIFGVGQSTLLGKSTIDTLTTDCMLRISIAPHVFGLYTTLNKFVIHAYASSRTGAYCTIDASIKDTPTVFKTFANKVPLYGGPAWCIINTPNLITYNNAPSSQFGLIRFTFGCTAVNTEFGAVAIDRIMAFGGVGWSTPSNMAKHGHLYNYNTLQEAKFPASITAPNFIGKVNGYTIETSVPANAKFTDTVYTHPATHPASMITGLSAVATSGSYNDLSNKPTIPNKVSAFANDAGYLTQHQSLDGYAKTSDANTWTAEQSLNNVNITYERYTASFVSGTSATPTASTAVYTATGNFNLDLNSIANTLINGQSTVFTAYINANADYALSITNAGTLKYIGSASDVAITSAGMLLNILMIKDASGNLTSIVQASKLS